MTGEFPADWTQMRLCSVADSARLGSAEYRNGVPIVRSVQPCRSSRRHG